MSAAPILPIPVPLDPLTAALQLVNSILNLIAVVVESQPPDVRATLWRMHVEDLKEWRAFLKSLKLPPEPPAPSGLADAYYSTVIPQAKRRTHGPKSRPRPASKK
jgi:hypothetical protein